MGVRVFAVLVVALFVSSCGDDGGWNGARWEDRAIERAELVDDRTVIGIWLEPGEYAHPSCNQIDLRTEQVDDELRIIYRSLRTSQWCEMDLPISEDRGTIQIPLTEPIPAGIELTW